MMAMQTWRTKAKQLKLEVYTLYLAYRDHRVPWYAKTFAACVVASAFSPIDLIPDSIPILGYLDDLILIPLGVILARKMIPKPVLEECRAKAKEVMKQGRPTNWFTAIVIIAVWLALALLAIIFVIRIIIK